MKCVDPVFLVINAELSPALRQEYQVRGVLFKLSAEISKPSEIPKSITSFVIPGIPNPDVDRVIALCARRRNKIQIKRFGGNVGLHELLKQILPPLPARKSDYGQFLGDQRNQKLRREEENRVDPADARNAKLQADLCVALQRIELLESQNDRLQRQQARGTQNPLFAHNPELRGQVSKLTQEVRILRAEVTRLKESGVAAIR